MHSMNILYVFCEYSVCILYIFCMYSVHIFCMYYVHIVCGVWMGLQCFGAVCVVFSFVFVVSSVCADKLVFATRFANTIAFNQGF